MNNILKLTLALGFLAVGTASHAGDFMVTKEKAKGNQVVGLDYQSDGKATALQLRFKLNGLDAANVDISKCTASVPKSFGGQCAIAKDKGILTVLVYSDSNALLPQGLISIGSVSIRSMAKGNSAAGTLDVQEVLAFDADGKQLSAQAVGDVAK